MTYYILSTMLTITIVMIVFTTIKKQISWDNFYGRIFGISLVIWGMGESLEKGFYFNVEKITLFWGIFVVMFGLACIDQSLENMKYQERVGKKLRKFFGTNMRGPENKY